jgi:predicted Co/Zn/Cd cation transporter (cation efflux family)
MTYKQAIPIIYRKVKEQGKPINILTLTRKMKDISEKHPNISDQAIESIVEKIVSNYKRQDLK